MIAVKLLLDVYMEIPFGKETFEVTALVHPTAYINKILFASKHGQMRLYNLRKNELVYMFAGWDSNITILEQVSIRFYFWKSIS